MDLVFMASNYDDRSSSYADNLSFSPKNVQNARLQSSLIWKVIICWIEIRSRQKRKLCMKCALLYSNLLLLEYNPKLRLGQNWKIYFDSPHRRRTPRERCLREQRASNSLGTFSWSSAIHPLPWPPRPSKTTLTRTTATLSSSEGPPPPSTLVRRREAAQREIPSLPPRKGTAEFDCLVIL